MNTAAGLLLAVACSGTADPKLPDGAVRVKACHGPTANLPDSLVRLLPSHGLPLIPDDEWAQLARTEPRGFAGVYYDSRHRPTIAVARPNEAAAAKVALVGASADKDELLNRIRFGALNVRTRDSIVDILERVDMPCDLVVVDLSGGIAVANGRSH